MAQHPLSIAECDAVITGPGRITETEECIIEGRAYRVWKKCPPTFQSFFTYSFRLYSSRTFLSCQEGVDYTFDHILRQSRQLARLFRAQGLDVGSRIAIGGPNSAHWIVCFIACHLIGGIAICINSWLPIEDMKYCLSVSAPELTLVDSALASRLDWPKTRSWDYVLEPSNSTGDEVDLECEGLHPESDAVIFFSSGGRPKAVLSTQRMALSNLWSGLVAPARAALRAGRPIPPPPTANDPQKVVLLAIPLFHVTGCLSWLMRAIYGGSNMVLLPRWDTRAAITAIIEKKVTTIGGVPAVVEAIMRSRDLPQEKHFETIFYGGAPARQNLASEIRQRWPATGLVQGYGLTETNAYVCSIAGPDYLQRPGSTGPPVPICDVKIVDPETRELRAIGSPGLLLVRGPQVMKGYVGHPATARAVDAEGWFDTGDIASVDIDGFVYIKDRHIIIRGGENIHSTEVEEALCGCPGVAEAVAVSVPDDVLGEQVGAVVYADRDGLEESDLIAIVAKRLSRRAVPVILLIQREPLARNVNGKVTKAEIRAGVINQWEKRGRLAARVQSKL